MTNERPDPPGLEGLGEMLERLVESTYDDQEGFDLYLAWKNAGRPGREHPTSIALEEHGRRKQK